MMAVDKRQVVAADAIDLTRAVAESDRQMRVSRRQQALLAGAGMDGEKRWAIIKVASRRDNDVDNALSAALIEHWLPLRKAGENDGGRRRGAPGQPVWLLAWPGYIFVRVVDTAAAWQGLASIKHVVSVLGAGERPFFVHDDKLLRIKAELATLKDVRKNADMLFVEGDTVRVVEGPFASFPGTVLQVSEGRHEGRALVEVMIFGRAVPVALDLAQIAK